MYIQCAHTKYAFSCLPQLCHQLAELPFCVCILRLKDFFTRPENKCPEHVKVSEAKVHSGLFTAPNVYMQLLILFRSPWRYINT